MRKVAERLLIEMEESAAFMDGFDGAIIGIGRQHTKQALVVYDRGKCIDILTGQGMTYEEAEEYFSFNCECAWVGESTPMIVTTEVYDGSDVSDDVPDEGDTQGHQGDAGPVHGLPRQEDS